MGTLPLPPALLYRNVVNKAATSFVPLPPPSPTWKYHRALLVIISKLPE